MLAWSGWFRHFTYATSCRTSDLITSGRLLDYMTSFLLGLIENIRDILLTLWLLATFGEAGVTSCQGLSHILAYDLSWCP